MMREWLREWAGALVAMLIVAVLVSLNGCGVKHNDADLDPQRFFVYGQMLFEDTRGAFLMTTQSLEHRDEERDVVIDTSVSDDTCICFEIAQRSGKHREVCLTVGELRRTGAPVP